MGDDLTPPAGASAGITYHTEETAFDRLVKSFKSGLLGVLYISEASQSVLRLHFCVI